MILCCVWTYKAFQNLEGTPCNLQICIIAWLVFHLICKLVHNKVEINRILIEENLDSRGLYEGASTIEIPILWLHLARKDPKIKYFGQSHGKAIKISSSNSKQVMEWDQPVSTSLGAISIKMSTEYLGESNVEIQTITLPRYFKIRDRQQLLGWVI